MNLNAVIALPVAQLHPNPWNRKHFKPATMRQLMASIAAGGIKEPLIVRRNANAKPKDGAPYEIASGNRRWLAAQELGLKEVPCLVLNLSDAEVQDMNLVTNIQREDLSPLEKARMIRFRMELGQLTPEQIAMKLGKSRPWVLELLGFLELPKDVITLLEDAPLSIRALRGLKSLDNPREQYRIAKQLKEGDLHHNQVERVVREKQVDPLHTVWSALAKTSEPGSVKVTYKGPGRWQLDILIDDAKPEKELKQLLSQALKALE